MGTHNTYELGKCQFFSLIRQKLEVFIRGKYMHQRFFSIASVFCSTV